MPVADFAFFKLRVGYFLYDNWALLTPFPAKYTVEKGKFCCTPNTPKVLFVKKLSYFDVMVVELLFFFFFPCKIEHSDQ